MDSRFQYQSSVCHMGISAQHVPSYFDWIVVHVNIAVGLISWALRLPVKLSIRATRWNVA